jgi:hypothetical protein
MYVPMCRYCLTSIYYSRYCTAVLLSIVRTYVHTVVGTWWLSVQSLLYSCTVVR